MHESVAGRRRAYFDIPALVPRTCSYIGEWMAEHLKQICHVCEGRSRIVAVSKRMQTIGCCTRFLRSRFFARSISAPWPRMCELDAMICVQANFPPASLRIHSTHVSTYFQSPVNNWSSLIQAMAWHWTHVTWHCLNLWWPSPVHFCMYIQHWLTHWGRVMYICISKSTSIGSDNGLAPGRRQAIIWIIGVILLIGPVGTNFSEILIKIHTFSFKNMHLKMSCKMAVISSQPQCV